MTNASLTIATRGSQLALWQANHIRQSLQALSPDLHIDLLTLKTQGDIVLDRSLADVGGKGLFVREIEHALLDGRADIAVHSLKDLTADEPEGLVIAAIPERADFRDAFVSNEHATLDALPKGAKVGTSSLRRHSQLLARRPDLEIGLLRGNVNTRLAKLDAGEFDAIILAAAGLKRLNMAERIRQPLEPEIMLPAVCQGTLAVQCRSNDEQTKGLLSALEHGPSQICATAERGLLEGLEGDCHLPMGAHATLLDGNVTLTGGMFMPDGSKSLLKTGVFRDFEARLGGLALAKTLRAAGGDEILAAVART